MQEPMPPVIAEADQTPVVRRARDLMQRLNWLSPLRALSSAPSSRFGRQIETSLAEVAQGEVVRLQLRRRDTAVVMSTRHYEEMLQMKALYQDLIEEVKVKDISQAAEDYEALYHRLSSEQSRAAADRLFSDDAGEIGQAWQPGNTETP